MLTVQFNSFQFGWIDIVPAYIQKSKSHKAFFFVCHFFVVSGLMEIKRKRFSFDSFFFCSIFLFSCRAICTKADWHWLDSNNNLSFFWRRQSMKFFFSLDRLTLNAPFNAHFFFFFVCCYCCVQFLYICFIFCWSQTNWFIHEMHMKRNGNPRKAQEKYKNVMRFVVKISNVPRKCHTFLFCWLTECNWIV